jgi:hypothetical protein
VKFFADFPGTNGGTARDRIDAFVNDARELRPG